MLTEKLRKAPIVTAEHQFWVDGLGWQGVEFLEAYHLLHPHNGEFARISIVEKLDHVAPAFHLEVDCGNSTAVGSRSA